MDAKPDILIETPSQTAGPYVHIGCIPSFAGIKDIYDPQIGQNAFEQGAKGEIITITGIITDGAGDAVCDAMLEAWQADANGYFHGDKAADPKVSGFSRFATDVKTGAFEFTTIKPGVVRNRNTNKMAPHICLWIAARGINIGLQTRIYFDDEDNSNDPIFVKIADPQRAATLIAKRIGDGQYRFDIRLQGDAETVFLDL